MTRRSSGSGDRLTARGRRHRPASTTASSVGGQVYEALRDAVLSNRFPPGKPLRQQAIAASLGVSRVPVRSALIQLEAEGLVQLLDRRGAVVRTHSADQVKELCRIRSLLEGYAMHRSMRTMHPGRVARLRELLAEADERSTKSVVDPRAEFYRELFDAEHNPELNAILVELRLQLSRYLYGWRRPASHADDHHELVEAVARGDGQEAVRLIHKNLALVRDTILDRLSSGTTGRGLRAVPTPPDSEP